MAAEDGAAKAEVAFRQVETGRLSRRVVVQFQQLIREGVLGTGDKLPAERDLAEQFRVSRNSVREALRELDLLGLVESRHGEGTFVRQPGPAELMAPFRTVIELSMPAADSIMEFRLAFEPGVAALAASNLTPEREQDLVAALERFEQAVHGEGVVETSDADFHLAVAQATGNPTVIAVHAAVYELLRDMRKKLSASTYHPHDRSVAGHRDLLEAICARDPDRAGRVMSEHLAYVAGGLRDEKEPS